MLAVADVGAPAVDMVSGFILEFGNTLTEGGDFYDAMDAGVKGTIVGGMIGFATEAIIAPVAQSIISKFDYHRNNAYSRTYIGDYMIQYDNNNGYQIFNSIVDEITESVMNNVVGNSINSANNIILASYSSPGSTSEVYITGEWKAKPNIEIISVTQGDRRFKLRFNPGGKTGIGFSETDYIVRGAITADIIAKKYENGQLIQQKEIAYRL